MKRRSFFKVISVGALSAPVIAKELCKEKELHIEYYRDQKLYDDWDISPRKAGGRIDYPSFLRKSMNEKIFNEIDNAVLK